MSPKGAVFSFNPVTICTGSTSVAFD
jgi:hypothetical protein